MDTPVAGASILGTLEAMGVAARVNESDFFCDLDLSGSAEDLIACASRVLSVLAAGRIGTDAIEASRRVYSAERRAYRLRPYGQAEALRWRGHVIDPRRVYQDCVDADPDAAGSWSDGSCGRFVPDGIVVVGRRDIASAWVDAIDTVASVVTAADPPRVRLTSPRPMTMAPARSRSQSAITWGAVELLDDGTDMFGLDLAMEVLAGWPGSVLNRLFRYELAWSYGVGADIRTACVGDQTVLYWSLFLQAAADRTRAVVDHITRQVQVLLGHCPSDDEVRRAASRILRRDLLFEDSVADVMSRYGTHVQSGLATLAERRRRHLEQAGADDLRDGLNRMQRSGSFVVVGPCNAPVGEEDCDGNGHGRAGG
jgi:hypothetical protein